MDGGGGAGAVLTTIRTVAETGSTNTDMAALAGTGLGEGVWLRAERQTAGRGRQARAWSSPAGNFSASTLVRLRPSDSPAATLALVAGVTVEEVVRTLLAQSLSPFRRFAPPSLSRWERSAGSTAPRAVEILPGVGPIQHWAHPAQVSGTGEGEARLKWPNDLLLDGAKLAGILLERADAAVVVGVGMNLAHHPDLPNRSTTSLAAHGVEVAPETVADMLAEAFSRWLARWRGEGIAPVRARWLERAHPAGAALTARLPDGSALDGLFDGLDADGALMLRLAGGETRVIHAGDVFLL